MQCKDIPDKPILEFLRDLPDYEGHPGTKRTGTWFDFEPRPINSVLNAMPDGVTGKFALAKMKMLHRRGLVSGCPCGCRGDFEITEKGLALIAESNAQGE